MYRQRIDDLVVEILNNDSVPLSQQTFQTANIAQFADDSLQATVVPLITSCMEEYFVTTYSTEVGPTANTISIPGETAGFRVRDLYMFNLDSGNTDFNMDMTARCVRINPDTRAAYAGSIMYPPNLAYQARPFYYIENNVLKFYPTLSNTWLAKLRVLKAPNHLVEYNRCCGQILSKIGSNQVTVDNVPQGSSIPVNTGGLGDWTLNTGPNATTVDVLQPEMPFNFRLSTSTGFVLIGKSIVAVNGVTITLDADTYASVQVGDFLVTNQCSPFLQYMPFEAYNLVKILTSMRILKAQARLGGVECGCFYVQRSTHGPGESHHSKG